MRRATRATALTAAAFLFCAGLISGPALAQRADRDSSALSAKSLGLDGLADPTDPDEDSDARAPAPTRAIAPALPDGQAGESEWRAPGGRSLADLVYAYQSADTPDEESDCLARAVYWESKSEPLAGQPVNAAGRPENGRFGSLQPHSALQSGRETAKLEGQAWHRN